MKVLKLEEPSENVNAENRLAVFALGFRPFYALAALLAMVAIPAWVMVFSGRWSVPLPGIWWHAHEMLFGFAAAVIVGFLFTAGKNWTGLPTPTGLSLALLAGLWLAGRVAMATTPAVWGAVLDTAFLPVAAVMLLRVLLRARSHRNYFIGVIPLLLGLSNGVFHLATRGVLAVDPLLLLHFALAVVVLLETIITGRVVPMFTANALRGVRQWQHKTVNLGAVVFTGAALLLWALDAGAWAVPLTLAAAILQLVRSLGWNPRATLGTPLLWILHVGALWIPVGLFLLAVAQLGWMPRSAGVHALAIGATGGLIIGMMTRTALGHTGRMLVAGRMEMAAYVLITLAAIIRVLTVALIPVATLVGIHLAATLWSLGFLCYLIRYLPILMRPRLDGRPG